MRIGIVGLGIGGATAAAAMVRRGLDVTVFEQTDELREVGAGVATWPNTIRLYRRLGIGERLDEIGCTISPSPIREPSGAIRHHIAVETYDGTPGYYLHRAQLLEAIVALIPPERIRLNSRCRVVTERGDQAAIVLADGREEVFDVVIGGDGIRSVSINAVVEPSPPIYANLAAYRGLVRNVAGARLDTGSLWTDRTKYFVAFPVSSGSLVNFVGVVPTPGRPEESWFMTGSKEALAAEFADWDPAVCRIIDQVDATFRWGLYYREPLRRIVHGRIALIGDAAHPMLIHAGQGVGQAMEDGFALAVLLDGASVTDVEERLALYQQLRLQRATAVQALSRHNAQFMHADFPVAPGETRQDRASSVDWIINYDVEEEAEALLRGRRLADSIDSTTAG